MTKREATRLAKRIDSTPGLTVTGYRRWPTKGGSSWEINVQDHVSGVPFVVHNSIDWAERVAAAAFWEDHEFTY